nr:heat shock protein 90-like protein [Blackberry dwarf-associated virus]
MALSATSTYVPTSPSDESFLKLLQSLEGEVDVGELSADVYDYLKRNYQNISGRFTLGSFSCSTWYNTSAGVITAWSDSEGWARHLLANYLAGRNVLAHLYYPLASELPSALATPNSVLLDKLSRVGKSVLETSPFSYKVSRLMAEEFARSIDKYTRHTVDLTFCVGNYLGRLPTVDEISGSKILPIAAVRPGSLLLDTGHDTTLNEQRLALLNLRGKNKLGDPVEGVYFKTRLEEIKTVASFMFRDEHVNLILELPAVKFVILSCLKEYPIVADTFEERVESMLVVQAKARNKLKGLLPFKEDADLDVTLSKASTLPGEIFRGDSSVIRSRYERNTTGGLLMKVGSRFSVEEYSKLTRRLVASLLNKNLNISLTFTECVLLLLQRYIHYRTNALRFVNLPTILQITHKSKVLSVDFSGVDEVFMSFQGVIPEIERAWCAPLADVAYMLLKDTGGSFAKWKDIPEVPAHMNFDFVGYVNPALLSEPELKTLATIVNRFRNKETPVRGFGLGNRLSNPIDYMVNELKVDKREATSLKSLVKNQRSRVL